MVVHVLLVNLATSTAKLYCHVFTFADILVATGTRGRETGKRRGTEIGRETEIVGPLDGGHVPPTTGGTGDTPGLILHLHPTDHHGDG